MQSMKNNKRKIISVGIVFSVMISAVIFASIIFPHGNDLSMDKGLLPPGAVHLFGTDNLGRDLFERTFNGMRLSLALAISIQAICLCFGALAGSIAGYYGGMIDRIYMLVQNVMMSFPGIIASLCLIAIFGTGIQTLVLALAVVGWVTYARLIRSEVISLKEADYIHACRAIGASNFYILFRYLLPNVIMPIIPIFTLMIGHTVLAISGLGFLGFGVQPPDAEIGLMIKDGITYVTRAPWMIICPAFVLTAYSLVINVFGDELRQWFDPQKDNLII
jgi:peptide/nickel transport system permease protein